MSDNRSAPVADGKSGAAQGSVVDERTQPPWVPDEVTDPDLLVMDLGRRGLRARRTGVTPTARLDPPRRARHSRPATVDVEELVTSLAPMLAAHPHPPAYVVASVHDAAHLLDADALHARLAAVTGAPTVICDALLTTLVGARGEVAPGIVLDMGASTVGLATDLDTVWHRLDGWGPPLGDRGSATWLGAQGLAAALRARDGVPDGSLPLLEAGRAAFGDEAGWAALVRGDDGDRVLADFASAVAEVSRLGDEVARAAVRQAGEHLADTLMAGKALLPGEHITATGELLLVEAIRVSLASALGKRFQIVIPALADSLAGAHVLGRFLSAGGTLPHRPPFVWSERRPALTR